MTGMSALFLRAVVIFLTSSTMDYPIAVTMGFPIQHWMYPLFTKTAIYGVKKAPEA